MTCFISHRFLLFLLTTFLVMPTAALPTPPIFTVEQKKIDTTHSQLTLTYTLDPNDALFKDSLLFSVNSPDVELSWSSTKPAQQMYIPSFKADKDCYTGTGAFIVTLTHPAGLPETTLFVHYRLQSSTNPQEFITPISFEQTEQPETKPHEEQTTVAQSEIPATKKEANVALSTRFAQFMISIKQSLYDLVTNTQSTPLRLLFVFILGLLMSLTPCIYPMIPVTVGILQTSASSSLMRNFLLAFAYTMGIATTFATLGLLAASGSAHFGALLGNVYFVLFLVLFLGYLAFSMLGFYDMYTPKFMRGGDSHTADGSYISAFIFGVISGSVASPCLSPGLLLLLSIVATLGSKLLGFLYLFMFGLGLGVPLLIIGTFSNSMNVLPRAGLWMVEVKKLFGFLLLSMCFFYLSNVIDWALLLWMIGFALLASGLLYVTTIERYHSFGMRVFKYTMGIGLLTASFLVFFNAYKTTVYGQSTTTIPGWYSDFDTALKASSDEKRFMIIDFGAQWCSLCNEIEHKLLQNPIVQEKLTDIIFVKIDCTNPDAEPCASLQQKFEVVGFPTIIFYDTRKQGVVERWDSKLIDVTPEEFLEMVRMAGIMSSYRNNPPDSKLLYAANPSSLK